MSLFNRFRDELKETDQETKSQKGILGYRLQSKSRQLSEKPYAKNHPIFVVR
jgi:hypothetical protein